MEPCWQNTFLDGLLVLDEAESPHGLYGIRMAYAKKPKRVPALAQILKSSDRRPNFIERLGYQVTYSGRGPDRVNFFTDLDHGVELCILDYASTKVRHFGSSFRLDVHNRKQAREPDWDLERLIPKLATERRSYFRRSGFTHAVLLVAHAPALKGVHTLLRRTLDEGFLGRYAVSLHQREWKDRYDREFWTGVYLWSGRSGLTE